MTELKPSEVIPSIIAAAVAAAGPMGNSEGAWKAKVNRAIPHITSMLNDGSRQWKTALEVLEAHVFTGQYVRHEIEDSSTRAILYVDVGRPSDNYPDGIEEIRTHRTDNAAGKDQLARIERLEPGDELVLWRAMENIAGTTKSVRTLVHLETRPKRTQSPSGDHASPSTAREQQPPPRPAAAPTGRTSGESDSRGERRGSDRAEELETPEPARQPAPYTDEINSKRLQMWRTGARESLTNAEFHELGLTLAESGFDYDGVSEIEWVDHVRPLIKRLIDERR